MTNTYTSITKDDRLILKKQISDTVSQIGDAYKIARFVDDKVVIKNARTNVAEVVLPISEVYDYFDKELPKANSWTKWCSVSDFGGNILGYYKTNQKKVLFKDFTGKYRGKASCCPNDDFDLGLGIQIAYVRSREKYIQNLKDTFFAEIYEEWGQIKKFEKDIKGNKNDSRNVDK